MTTSRTALLGLGILAAFGVGFASASQGTFVIGAFLALALAGFAYAKPQPALILWLVVTAVVPYWTTVYVIGVGFPPSAAVGVPVLVGIATSRFTSGSSVRLSWMDWSIISAALIVTFLWWTGELEGFFYIRDLLLVWMLAYVLGRCASGRVMTAFPVLMACVAAWGLIEFTFGMHLFADWMPSANHTLNVIQERAGVARSEAAFGHAIAYGAALVMAIPFAQRLRRHALLVQFLLVAGVAVSLSRGPLLGLVLTLVLSTWVLADSKLRVRYTLLTVLGGGAAYLILTNLYSGVYSDEVTGSGNARLDQYFAVRDHLDWLSSALVFSGPNGEPIVAGLLIIDSTPLRLAVNYGIITAALFLIPVAVAALRVLRRKAGPASVALAGQIPVLLVTSLITQWQMLIFFMMGVVVTEVLDRRATAADRDGSSEPLRRSMPYSRQSTVPGRG